MKDKVWILGTGPASRTCVDWAEDADYWVFNEVAGLSEKKVILTWDDGISRPYWCEKVTGSFQMHAPLFWRHPVYMQDVYPDVPESVKYPLEEIIEKLLPGFHRTDNEVIKLLTSTAAMAIALAIYQGYKTISLAGIDMGRGEVYQSLESEYRRQAEGIALWLGIAVGRGIEVIIPKESYIYRDKMYGYGAEIMIMKEEFEIHLEREKTDTAKLQAKSFALSSKAFTLLDTLLKTDSQAEATRILPEFTQALKDSKDCDFQYGIMVGKAMADTEYIQECEDKIRAAGGEKAVKEFLSYGVIQGDTP
jgi:hypothetical protein